MIKKALKKEFSEILIDNYSYKQVSESHMANLFNLINLKLFKIKKRKVLWKMQTCYCYHLMEFIMF